MAKLHHPHAGLLLVRNKKQIMIPLNKDVMTIGRKQADIILDDPKVSSTHAEVRRQGAAIVLVDLKSTNGTFVNRQQVTEHELADQDVVEIGLSTLCYFEDRREFHGNADEAGAGLKVKVDTVSVSEGKSVTTTRTIAQLMVELAVIEGPDAGKKFKFKKPHITIGRNNVDLMLVDLDVSRSHVMLEVLGRNSVFVRDMGSTNGTLLNGRRVSSEKLQPGDEIQIGNTKMKVSFNPVEGSEP